MSKRSNLVTKVRVFVIVVIFLHFLLVSLMQFYDINNLKNAIFLEKVKNFENVLKEQIVSKKNTWITNAMLLSENSLIKQAILKNDREQLKNIIADIGQKYSKNSPFKKVRVQIVSNDLRTIFKSWDVDSFGAKVDFKVFKKVLRTKNPITTFDKSYNGILLRSVFPIKKDGKVIAMLSFSGGINNFGKFLKILDIDFLYFLDEKYALMLKKAKYFKDGYPLSSTKNINKDFLNYVISKDFSLLDAIESDYHKDKKYFSKAFPLKDYEGITVGYALLASKSASISQLVDNAIEKSKLQILIRGIFDLVLMLILYFAIGKIAKSS